MSQRFAPSRLPQRHLSDVFEGRDKELGALDSAWADALAQKQGRARIITLVAIGGAGKSTLAVRWKNALLGSANHGGVERYLDWSFYSQGTVREGDQAGTHTAASADLFVNEALRFFGDDTLAANAPAWDKGARIAELAAHQRTLLILDGLEPLQYGPGPQQGELKDGALPALFAGLTQHSLGLCLLTTRAAIKDLQATQGETTPQWTLDRLCDRAGALVLQRHGVNGPPNELEQASREVQGHALTLTLMGRYLPMAFPDNPDIARRDCFHFQAADAETQNGHAFRVFAAYEAWFAREGRTVELAILRLLGLFDRPATPDCLEVLRQPPVIAGLTKPLVGLGDQQWNVAVSRLKELGLVETQRWEARTVQGFGEAAALLATAKNTQLGKPWPFSMSLAGVRLTQSLDAHPLLREYFANRLSSHARSAWQAAHVRLFDHLAKSVPFWPEGADGLQPLYQAVAHGCKAGRYDDALIGVYRDRIYRGTEPPYGFYSSNKLGLHGMNLAAAACFFVEPWRRPAQTLQPSAQAWLLNDAAFYLRGLNRLSEAREPMRVAMESFEQQHLWANAAIVASNLSEVELTLGYVTSAEQTALKAVNFADLSKVAFRRVVSRCIHADALHQAGRDTESRARFEEAEAMQAEVAPHYPLLFSVRGYRYCDLLLVDAARTVWGIVNYAKSQPSGGKRACAGENSGDVGMGDLEIAPMLAEIELRATKVFELRYAGESLLTIGLAHLGLARVHLYRVILEQTAVPIPNRALATTHQELTIALAKLREAGQILYLPFALFPLALMHAVAGEPDGARQRLDEARAIATRGGMRLFLIDTLLHRARIFLRADAYPWPGSAADDLTAAAKLIDDCGYHCRDRELADAKAACSL